MKIATSIIIFALLLTDSIQKRTDLELSGLNGNIKAIKTIDYTPSFNNNIMTLNKMSYSFIKYNREGNLLKKQVKSPSGTTMLDMDYYYDKTGKLITNKTMIRVFGTVTYLIDSFYYNSEGHNINTISLNQNNKTKSVIRKEFDTSGNVLKSKFYNDKNEITAIKEFKYDENSNIIEEKRFKGDSIKENTLIMMYENNKLIEKKIISPNDSVIMKETFEYIKDRQNNWLIRKCFYNDKLSKIDKRKIKYY